MNASTTIQSMPVITVNDMLTQVSNCSVRQVRPWVRYFARMVDVFLFSLLAGIVLGLYVPSVTTVPSSMLTIAILFAWIFQESVFLANCGTTPGKWFFKIKVRNSRGQKLTFSEALNRSFGVWSKGMAAGVPLLNLITLLSSRSKLKREGITAWDEDGGFVVTHGKIGVLRSAVVTVLILGFYSFATVGSTLEGREGFELAADSVENQVSAPEPTQGITTNTNSTYIVEYQPQIRIPEIKANIENTGRESKHNNNELFESQSNDSTFGDNELKGTQQLKDVTAEVEAEKPATDNDKKNVQYLVELADKWLEN